jgi:hypothetical protein
MVVSVRNKKFSVLIHTNTGGVIELIGHRAGAVSSGHDRTRIGTRYPLDHSMISVVRYKYIPCSMNPNAMRAG